MKRCLLVILALFVYMGSWSQSNLLLNGGFEDVNTCTEYNAECGVEAWFYLKDVTAQMLSNETNTHLFGANSFGIFYKWRDYKGFTPIIGAVLSCALQKDKRYTFKGLISAKLHTKLILQPGICVGEKFYVPNRPFSKNMHPDSIVSLKAVPNTPFFEFEYSFVANGAERFLTFGTYTREDTTGAKKVLLGIQTISLVLDNFQLLSEDDREIGCPDSSLNKKDIYDYNFRHKEMDYSLYGRGDLNIAFTNSDSNSITQIKELPPPPVWKPDTLKLGDVFFDFNKASLKPEALKVLKTYFLDNRKGDVFDSIIVNGHTDSIGKSMNNYELSFSRISSVSEWLVENHVIAPGNLFFNPYGETRPIATNKTPEGRALNRRVELIVFRRVKN